MDLLATAGVASLSKISRLITVAPRETVDNGDASSSLDICILGVL